MPEPSPSNDPENEPLTPVAPVKSTFEPDINNEPVIIADPENGNPSPPPLL